MKLFVSSLLCALAAILLPRADESPYAIFPHAPGGIVRATSIGDANQTSDDRGYALSPEQLWLHNWAVGSSFLAAGDVEGNHRADLLSVSLETGDLSIVHTSTVGKPEADSIAFVGFAHGVVAVACGAFGTARSEGVADAVVAVCANGEVRIASDMRRNDLGYLHFENNKLAAVLTPSQMPQAPLEAIVGDFDGDGAADLLLLGSDNRGLLLRASREVSDGSIQFRPIPMTMPFPNHHQVGAGSVAGAPSADRRTRLFYLDGTGILFRSALLVSKDQKIVRLAPPIRVTDGIAPDARLAVGHFCGAPESDLIVGSEMLVGANALHRYRLPALPPAETLRGDRAWLVADFDGNGKDDLLRARKPSTAPDTNAAYIHFSLDPAREQAAGYYASSHDGLPDAWKLGLIHPGGLDLKALGCLVGRYDLIAEIIPLADVSQTTLHAALDDVARHYAALPVRDPDGSTGISIHYIYRDPIPESEVVRKKGVDLSSVYARLWPSLVIPGHVGVVHYVSLHNIGINGGGATDTFMSFCNTDWRGIMHEMGHQLGLTHGGGEGFQEMPATYPSLMNYAYSLGIDGSRQDVSYSTGSLAALSVLNEEHLDETVPLSYDAVKFMAGPPYHFHMKPGSDPNTTLIDWNWDGVFGEKDVRADLNYSEGIETAPQFKVARSYSAPVTVAQMDAGGKARLLLFTGMPPAGRDAADSGGDDLTPQSPGRLWVRVWAGEDRDRDGARWSLPIAIAKGGVTGDSTAVSVGGAIYVAYPTAEGVAMHRLTVKADGTPIISAAALVPASVNASPALAACGDGHVAVVLWRDPKTPMTLSILPIAANETLPNTKSISAAKSLGIFSAAPVAAVAGAADKGAGRETNALWIARIAGAEAGKRADHFEACRFDCLQLGADPVARLAARLWVHGDFAQRRAALLWEPEPGLGPQGRLYILAGGRNKADPETGAVPQFCDMETAYPEETEGWQLRRFDKMTFLSRSAPTACWFDGNMVYAARSSSGNKPSRNDMVTLTFYGTGATPQPIGYFNDLAYITRYGLSQKIETVRVP